MRRISRTINIVILILITILGIYIGLILPFLYLRRGIFVVTQGADTASLYTFPVIKEIVFMNMELLIFWISAGVIFVLLILLFSPQKGRRLFP